MKITVGRTVLYVLSHHEAEEINAKREKANFNRIARDPSVVSGTQEHRGNTVVAGDIYPAVAVRVFGDADNPPVNLQVLLDGNDSHWATSRHEDATQTPGTWHWPVIAR